MSRIIYRNLAKTVAFGGVMAVGLGSAQVASAGPAVAASQDRGTVTVPCSTPALEDVRSYLPAHGGQF